MATTTKKTAAKTAPRPRASKADTPKAEHEDPPDGYVWVSRTVTTVDDPDDDRAPGYVHIPGEEEPRLVDAKSAPELEALGYRVVDAPKSDDSAADDDDT